MVPGGLLHVRLTHVYYNVQVTEVLTHVYYNVQVTEVLTHVYYNVQVTEVLTHVQASTFSFRGARPLGLKSSKKERGTKAN